LPSAPAFLVFLFHRRFFQMAIQRAEAQTSILAKLAPPHTVLTNSALTAEPRLVSVVSVPYLLFSFIHST